MEIDQGSRDRQPGDELRTILAKWSLAAGFNDQLESPAGELFDRAWAALSAARLDEAEQGFGSLVKSRAAAPDFTGLGDVCATRGDWQRAGELYGEALRMAPTDPVARVGWAQAMVATGRAELAIVELERLVIERDEPTRRAYLVSALWSLTTQARSMTTDGTLFVATERQLDTCEQAAQRIVQLEPADPEIRAAAEQLLEEIAADRTWRWDRGPVAGTLVVLIALAGAAAAAVGGLIGNIPLMVSAAIGAPLLVWVVLRFRRQAWRLRADRLRLQAWHGGALS